MSTESSAAATNSANLPETAALEPKASEPKASEPKASQSNPASNPSLKKQGAEARAKAAADESVMDYFSVGRVRIEEAFANVAGRMEGARAAAREAGTAMQESQTQAVAGLRDLSDAALNGMQGELDRYFDTVRSMTEAGSLTDLFQIQANYLKDCMAARSQDQRIYSEITLDMARAAFEPLQAGLMDSLTAVAQERK